MFLYCENDLVIQANDPDNVMRVLEDQAEDGTIVYCAIGNDDASDYFLASDLKLVRRGEDADKFAKPAQPQLNVEENTVTIMSFAGALKREVKRVRERLQACDEVSEFRLSIEASGRTRDGEVVLEYSLSKQYGGSTVKGNSIDAVVDEFVRRNSWNNNNAPLAISFNEASF